MQLDFIFQNWLVVVVACFGASCTMGLAVILPIVANAVLAIYSAVAGEMTQARFAGVESGALFPDERKGPSEQVIIGYPPGYSPSVGAPVGPVEVESDEPPTGMLVRLAIAVTVIAALAMFGATKLFQSTLASQLESKGYSADETRVPRSSSK